MRPIALALALAAGCSSSADHSTGPAGDDLAAPEVADLAAPPGTDLAISPRADLRGGTVDLAQGAAVGPHGGSVDRLFFAFHGDTRPDTPDDTASYPNDVIRAIYQREAVAGVQFAVDLGDHLNATVAKEAQAQMKLYAQAAALLGRPTFMTMGNHECTSKALPCDPNDPDFAAYAAALAPVSPTPWYSVDVKTSSGLATFVFVADNAWGAAQAQWLDATLAKADAAAKYTFVMRHHPYGYAKLSVPDENALIAKHKVTLRLTSHKHLYSRDPDDPSGRSVILGCAGASLDPSQDYYGYGTVKQELDDTLTVTIFDEATDAPQDTFSVTP